MAVLVCILFSFFSTREWTGSKNYRVGRESVTQADIVIVIRRKRLSTVSDLALLMVVSELYKTTKAWQNLACSLPSIAMSSTR